MADQKTDKSMATTATIGAAILGIALLVMFFFLANPGREVPSGGVADQAIAPAAQTTTDLNGNTDALTQSAPPDTTGAGPNQNQTR
jgi:hypothetical protein